MNEDQKNVIVYSPGMKRLALSVQCYLATQDTHVAAIAVEQKTFSNGEDLARITETVRHQHVFFFHELQLPDPNTAFMRMLITANALKYASVASITLVVPYMSYLRQDRKDKPRVPITARLIAELIEVNKKIEHIITLDMHADQEQGFFSIPVDNLNAMQLFANHVSVNVMAKGKKVVAVAPDFGSVVRTRRFAKKLGLPIAIIEKNRPQANVSEVLTVIGKSVKGASIVVFDDMADTGGTIRGVVNTLVKKHGAVDAHICVTHGIFSGEAPKKFREAGLKVVATDSIPRSNVFLKRNSWLSILSLETMLGQTISENMKAGGSVSKLSA